MVAIIAFSAALSLVNDRTFADLPEALYNINRETGLTVRIEKAQIFTHDNILVGAVLSTDQHAGMKIAENEHNASEGRKWAAQVVYPRKRQAV